MADIHTGFENIKRYPVLGSGILFDENNPQTLSSCLKEVVWVDFLLCRHEEVGNQNGLPVYPCDQSHVDYRGSDVTIVDRLHHLQSIIFQSIDMTDLTSIKEDVTELSSSVYIISDWELDVASCQRLIFWPGQKHLHNDSLFVKVMKMVESPAYIWRWTMLRSNRGTSGYCIDGRICSNGKTTYPKYGTVK